MLIQQRVLDLIRRLLVGFRKHFKSLHFHFISFHFNAMIWLLSMLVHVVPLLSYPTIDYTVLRQVIDLLFALAALSLKARHWKLAVPRSRVYENGHIYYLLVRVCVWLETTQFTGTGH